MTWQEAFQWGKGLLNDKNVPDSNIDARYLLEYVLQIDHNQFFVRGNELLKEEDFVAYQKLIEKRRQRIPLQHLIGKTEFMGLPFFVNDKVLVPRQETEELVEFLLPMAKKKRVLDLCTGSGCIGISIAVLEKSAKVYGSDISEEAIQTAKENVRMNQADVTLFLGDLFENVYGKFDIIVSNPPYIRTRDIAGLMPEVRDYEPLLALDGKADGCYFYHKITEQAGSFLNSNGILAFEIGYNQAEKVSGYMKEQGFVNIDIKKDLTGLDRMVFGEWPGKLVKR